MAKEQKVEGADSPAIGRGSIILFLTLASVFGLIAVWPLTPPIDSLISEEAHILKVRKDGHASTTTDLKTISGHDVKCWHGRTGGCDPDTMKSFLENKTPVMVWHDGEKVYQLVAKDKMILSYKHFHKGRWFSVAVSIISLLVALIQVGIRKGFIGVATIKKNPKT